MKIRQADIVNGLAEYIDRMGLFIDALTAVKEKAGTLTHYKTINQGYINKLEEVLPQDVRYFRDDGSEHSYSSYYVRAGYKSFMTGKYDTLEVGCRSFKLTERESTEFCYRVGFDETGAVNIPQSLDKLIAQLREDIADRLAEFNRVSDIVKEHNDMVDILCSMREKQDKVSYLVRRMLPEIKLPYVSKFDLVIE